MTEIDSSYACAFRARLLPPVALAACAFFAATTMLEASAAAAPAPKVNICHIPPGNPANFHTIKVSENALSAHLAHGDAVGACNDVCATLCDDNDECTVDDYGDCATNGCPTGERDPISCFLDDCHDDLCDPATGCVNAILEGAPCDDGMACTVDVCDASGACVGTAVANCCVWPDDENRCGSTFCNGRFCEDVLGTDDDVCMSTPPCFDDALTCTEDFCNEDAMTCDVTPIDDRCDDEIDCTIDSCNPSGDAPSGCENEPDLMRCPLGDVCHPLIECDPNPGGGCVYDDLAGCCVDDTDCPEGQECNESGPVPQCEPAQSTCVTAFDHIANGGDTSALIQDCQQNGDCSSDTRRPCNAPSGDLSLCARDGDRNACDRVNDFWQTQGGCSICAPTPVPESTCPCWDGGPDSPSGISNVVELWETYGPATCPLQDCQDRIFSTSTTTSAECLSGGVFMRTDVVSNTNSVDAQCTVRVNGQLLTRVNVPRDSSEAAACIAEHDMFITIGGTFPNYSTSRCGLGSF